MLKKDNISHLFHCVIAVTAIYMFSMTIQLYAQISSAVYGEKISRSSNFQVYFTFSDTVEGFSASSVKVDNGAAISGTGEYRHYSAVIEASSPGQVTISVPAGSISEKGGARTNTASNNFIVNAMYDTSIVTWKVDSDADWKEIGSEGIGFDFVDGEAKPKGTTATYSSIIKTFQMKIKPHKITFRQSPVWQNWTELPKNVSPRGAGDAPIFLPVANDDYYFFGNTNDGYAAWHSTDMINWEKYRAIASGSNLGTGHYKIGRWMTSAEYKDGKFYIIGDVPNDEDPHLWKPQFVRRSGRAGGHDVLAPVVVEVDPIGVGGAIQVVHALIEVGRDVLEDR